MEADHQQATSAGGDNDGTLPSSSSTSQVQPPEQASSLPSLLIHDAPAAEAAAGEEGEGGEGGEGRESKPPGYVSVPKPTRVDGMSKRVAKRLWRQEMWKVKKMAKKEAKKAARQQRQEDQAQQKAETVEPGLGKEPESHKVGEDPAEQQQRRWVERSTQRRVMREDFVKRCREGARVVVDCGFEEQMTEKELKSLGQQVMYMYASNKRAASPCFILATELGPKLQQRLSGVAGTQEWLGFERESRPYAEIFASERDKLVYLTSDSPQTLTTWDRSAIYIIGGIVDRNRLKGATYTKAQAQGIATARFPVQEYVTLDSTHVLAVNHVFDILLEFQRTNDWRAAFGKVLPQRKSPNWKSGDAVVADGGDGNDGDGGAATVVETESLQRDEEEVAVSLAPS